MSDVFVLDMASQNTEQSQVFVRRDSLAILDNQNQNYNGNQCIIDTSQLANSSKYMNYREAYLTIPMLLTCTGAGSDDSGGENTLWAPSDLTKGIDWSFGLKNWYGSVIHSFTLDYNGTTICQQVPFSGLWNTFRLMTTLSLDDVRTQGSLIGFYPDTAQTAGFLVATGGFLGQGTINNEIHTQADATLRQAASNYNSYSDTSAGPANSGINLGLYNRIQAWNFDPTATAGNSGGAGEYQAAFITKGNCHLLWQNFISAKENQTIAVTGPGVGNYGYWQASILGIVYLKHIHKFFDCVPLLKSAFLKLTLNLNVSSISFDIDGFAGSLANINVQTALNGVNPLMLASQNLITAADRFPVGENYIYSLSIGQKCQNQTQLSGQTYAAGALPENQVGGGSIMLNVPAYTFNPVFEQAYLSMGIKKIIYSDIYQFQFSNKITTGGTFNFLVTNGIADIKSVLVLPFFSKGTTTGAGADGNMGILPFQSPFDPAGGGPTSPYVQFTQFNIQVSGQNMIYNTEKYSYEHFVNQFKGVNAIDGGMADGTNSGLIGYKDWFAEYNYYYVNCARCLPLESSVPKSINILGTSASQKPIDLYVFVEYGTEISVDLTSGARV
jgi:hypothetical protein